MYLETVSDHERKWVYEFYCCTPNVLTISNFWEISIPSLCAQVKTIVCGTLCQVSATNGKNRFKHKDHQSGSVGERPTTKKSTTKKRAVSREATARHSYAAHIRMDSLVEQGLRVPRADCDANRSHHQQLRWLSMLIVLFMKFGKFGSFYDCCW